MTLLNPVGVGTVILVLILGWLRGKQMWKRANDFNPTWPKLKTKLEYFVWGNSLNKKEPVKTINGIFSIEPHDQSDKSFKIFGPIAHDCFIQIDYDDVNHQEIDAQTEAMVYVLNKWWNYSEIQNVLKSKLRENYVKQYEKEKIYEGFTREYPTLQDYLNQWGL